MSKPFKILCICSDSAGCFQYRCVIPFDELRRYNVEFDAYPYLPRIPEHEGGKTLDTFIRFVEPYDLVVIQRCYLFDIAFMIRQVCDILGKPFVFETDDDYLNIPKHNPVYGEMHKEGQMDKFVNILSMADYVTVTTEELRRIYYRFNKNIAVFPNNVERIHEFKDIGEMPVDENGRFTPIVKQGFLHIPSYVTSTNEINTVGTKVIRIGYSCNRTHLEDFKTIQTSLYKTLNKYGSKCLMVYMGDYRVNPEDPKSDFVFGGMHRQALGAGANVMSIPGNQYYMYHINTRNFDIGLAPLECNMFNMSKSQIKAVEYGAWGIPAVLPNLVTYTREFTNEVNCLTYNTKAEFGKCLERLIEDPELRGRLGRAARQHVATHRLEKLHGRRRYEFYKSLVESKRKLVRFIPNGNRSEESVGEQSIPA